MKENKQEFAYLITHMPEFMIDGITYDEESAKYLVDTLNKKYEKSRKCNYCRLSHFKYGEEKCDKAEIIRLNSAWYGSRRTIYCVNDVNDEFNECYIKFPDRYDYQKISVIDVEKMLGES